MLRYPLNFCISLALVILGIIVGTLMVILRYYVPRIYTHDARLVELTAGVLPLVSLTLFLEGVAVSESLALWIIYIHLPI